MFFLVSQILLAELWRHSDVFLNQSQLAVAVNQSPRSWLNPLELLFNRDK